MDIIAHDNLMSKWDGYIYATPGRLMKRTHHLKLLFPILKGKDVLEIGSNAGITATEIVKYSKSYTGIEPDIEYYKQALITNPPAAKFLNCQLANMGDVVFNALVVCVALYLLDKKEIEILCKKILPECDTVIIQERLANRPSNEKFNPYKLHKPQNIVKFLEENKFDADIYSSFDNKYFGVIGANTR